MVALTGAGVGVGVGVEVGTGVLVTSEEELDSDDFFDEEPLSLATFVVLSLPELPFLSFLFPATLIITPTRISTTTAIMHAVIIMRFLFSLCFLRAISWRLFLSSGVS